MRKAEKELAVSMVGLFRGGKLNFKYFYNPLYTFDTYDRRDDHEFIVEYNGLTIRLRRRSLMVYSKGTADKESFDIPLTRELKQIYKELYHKHESEIKEVLETSDQGPERRDTKLTDSGKGSILERLQ